jgi:hypothetical protein
MLLIYVYIYIYFCFDIYYYYFFLNFIFYFIFLFLFLFYFIFFEPKNIFLHFNITKLTLVNYLVRFHILITTKCHGHYTVMQEHILHIKDGEIHNHYLGHNVQNELIHLLATVIKN